MTHDPHTQEERVQMTDAVFRHTDHAQQHERARRQGHAVLSGGARVVRCAGCNESGMYGSPHNHYGWMNEKCPAALRVFFKR